MTILLKRAGFFKELGYCQPGAPSLKVCIGKMHEKNLQKTVAYLRSGKALWATPGVEYDILSGSDKIAGPPHIVTDGVWVWRYDLAYYVENYRVELPAGFIEHMVSQQWKIGDVDTQALACSENFPRK